MKLKKGIVVRESTCDICGRNDRCAGWNVVASATSRRTVTVRAELCAACATCLVRVLETFKTYMGSAS